MCSASVEPMPSRTGWPVRSLKRRWSSAGSASPAVTEQRTDANVVGGDVGVEQRGDEPGRGEEQRRVLRGQQLGHTGRRGAARVQHRRRADREGEGQRVAQPVREEQLGHGQGPVGRLDPEHGRRVRLGRGLEVGVAVHHALGQAGRAGAVEPEAGGVGAGGGHRRLVEDVVLAPRVDRQPDVAAGPRIAQHDRGPQLRRGLGDGRQVPGVVGRDDDDPGAGVLHDGGQVVRGEHGRERDGNDARPQRRRGTRP